MIARECKHTLPTPYSGVLEFRPPPYACIFCHVESLERQVAMMKSVYEAAIRWRRCDRGPIAGCTGHEDLADACADACDAAIDHESVATDPKSTVPKCYLVRCYCGQGCGDL